jgi:hypothetical protein
VLPDLQNNVKITRPYGWCGNSGVSRVRQMQACVSRRNMSISAAEHREICCVMKRATIDMLLPEVFKRL